MNKFDFKIEYNKAIQRLKKADVYFSNEKISIEERTSPKIIEHYNNLIKDISRMQVEYKRLYGEEMPIKTKHRGF